MRLNAIFACLVLAAGSPLALAATDASKSGASSAPPAERSAGTGAEDKAAAKKNGKPAWDTMTPEQKADVRKRHADKSKSDGKPRDPAAGTDGKKERSKPPADLPPPSAGPR
jgi:hypothetical protein